MVFEGMKEEISQQRCTVGVYWYTNNLPENRASKPNVDVVDTKVSSLQEKYVYLVDVPSIVQKVRKLLVEVKLFPLVLKALNNKNNNTYIVPISILLFSSALEN